MNEDPLLKTDNGFYVKKGLMAQKIKQAECHSGEDLSSSKDTTGLS